jgi:RecA-family ATPase
VLCLSPAEWEARDLPPEDKLLGPFSTTARAELSADTGLGKTMLGLALAHAMARGVPFLHWHPGRAGRVLYIDGEMPGELIKARLGAARSWFGLSEPLGRDRLCVLSKADVEDQMPPLDSPEGERWLLGFCEQVGRFDHITFDNRACLTIGDLFGDDASTQTVKSLQRELTKQKIGQLWLHHTGYEASRGYGRKSREWELDSVAVGERLEEQNDADVAMRITFKKARRRTRDNRADYEPVEVTLQRGEWLWSPADTEARSVRTTLGRNQQIIFDAATKLLAGSTTKAPAGHQANGATVVSVEALKNETRRMMACDPQHFSSRFNEALNGVANRHKLNLYDGYVWAPR